MPQPKSNTTEARDIEWATMCERRDAGVAARVQRERFEVIQASTEVARVERSAQEATTQASPSDIRSP